MNPEYKKVIDHVHGRFESLEALTNDTEWDFKVISQNFSQLSDECRAILRQWEKETEYTDADTWSPFIQIATLTAQIEVLLALITQCVNTGYNETARDFVFHVVETARSVVQEVDKYYAEKA